MKYFALILLTCLVYSCNSECCNEVIELRHKIALTELTLAANTKCQSLSKCTSKLINRETIYKIITIDNGIMCVIEDAKKYYVVKTITNLVDLAVLDELGSFCYEVTYNQRGK